MRLQIKDETFDEESMLNTGKADALKQIQDDIDRETQQEEEKLRYANSMICGIFIVTIRNDLKLTLVSHFGPRIRSASHYVHVKIEMKT